MVLNEKLYLQLYLLMIPWRDLVYLTALGICINNTKIGDVMHHPVLTISEQELHNEYIVIYLF